MDTALISVLKTMNKNLSANKTFQNYFRNIYMNLKEIREPTGNKYIGAFT